MLSAVAGLVMNCVPLRQSVEIRRPHERIVVDLTELRSQVIGHQEEHIAQRASIAVGRSPLRFAQKEIVRSAEPRLG